MARKVTVALVDDLDGGPAQETIRFALDGAGYEIDLSGQHAAAFRDQLAPFIRHARPDSPAPARPRASRQRSTSIRAWASQNGIALNRRGRIPSSVIAQYQTAAAGTASR